MPEFNICLHILSEPSFRCVLCFMNFNGRYTFGFSTAKVGASSIMNDLRGMRHAMPNEPLKNLPTHSVAYSSVNTLVTPSLALGRAV